MKSALLTHGEPGLGWHVFSQLTHYAETGSEPVSIDRAALESAGVELIEADLLAADGDLIRHDPEKLARVVLELAEGSA